MTLDTAAVVIGVGLVSLSVGLIQLRYELYRLRQRLEHLEKKHTPVLDDKFWAGVAKLRNTKPEDPRDVAGPGHKDYY